MKIIMNGIENISHVTMSYCAVRKAIQDGIKDGRNNYKSYGYAFHNFSETSVSVAKNKTSFTTHII